MTKQISLSPIYFSHLVSRGKTQEDLARAYHKSEQDGKKLKEACAQFESLFINQIMKQMRKTILKVPEVKMAIEVYI